MTGLSVPRLRLNPMQFKQPFDFDQEFAGHFSSAIRETEMTSGFQMESWMTAGFRPKQNAGWWQSNGPEMARAYAKWYRANPDINVWVTPDGVPAIELEVEVKFGNHPVKAAIDQVLVAGTAGLILDLKSGGHVPEDPAQLGMYACCVELRYGWRPRYGAYFMARGIRNKQKEITGYLTQPIELDGPQYSVEWYTRQLDQLDDAEKSGIYLPKLSSMCRMCGVNRACTAYGGQEAHVHDPDHPMNLTR